MENFSTQVLNTDRPIQFFKKLWLSPEQFLREFTATNNSGSVYISWKAKGIEEKLVYLLERSDDGQWFDVINMQSANSDLGVNQLYSFTDLDKVKNAFYRLRIISQHAFTVIATIKVSTNEMYYCMDYSA
jgi:hypothetical protein